MLSRLAVCALVVVAVGCGGNERRAATAPQVPKDALLGIITRWNGTGTLWWLEPDRLAAFPQSSEIVVVDPRSGQETSREKQVLANARGLLRKLTFEDIGVGYAHDICEEAGMAVDPERLVAYVAGAGARIAEVDLRRGRVIARSRGGVATST